MVAVDAFSTFTVLVRYQPQEKDGAVKQVAQLSQRPRDA